MYCYWNLVHRIPAVVKVGTVSSLAAPGAVVMTVSCATGEALSTYLNRRTPRSCGRYFLKHLILYPVCMLGILLWFYWTHAIIYVSWRFLTKFYDMCNPEILCNCLFYLLFTCTLSEMMNKRCPINQSLKPRQDGRRFPDGTFERIFLNENVIILIKISLKFLLVQLTISQLWFR